MSYPKTIYYGYPGLSSFVQLDLDYLSSETRVLHRNLQWKSKPRLFLNVFLQACFLIRYFRTIDAVVISFAGYHSYLPVLYARLRGIPAFIVLNGTDSVGIEQLGYGSHLNKLMRYFCKASVRKATELWPVHGSLIDGRNDFTGQELSYGIRRSFSDVRTPFKVIPNGFEADYWKVNEQKGAAGALTVVSSESQFRLKGVDLFLEAAAAFPEMSFSIVGMLKPEGLAVAANVQFLGRVEHTKMKEVFARHRYYFQLSSFEGFGCSLCEAMLSGCIPIGSNVNAIPEIIRETGGIVRKRDLAELTSVIRMLQQEPTEKQETRSKAAVERITEQYAITDRITQMLERIRRYQPGK